MAAEIPVSDVLCEAMEYLTKLGSNLRIRSENLKEKKIRKDKLTNSLAVQKAASKVLLICELSKKSLANVEAGMRKVLNNIDISQASQSVGGISSSSKTDSKRRDDKPKYHYIDYKSRKLKIKSKISLEHYKSVKVLARKMSISMLDKYPVYHDCRLYRMRRKEQPKKPNEHSGNAQEDLETEKDASVADPADHRVPSAEKESKSNTLITYENKKRSSEKTRRRNSKSEIEKYPFKKKSRVIYDDSDDQVTEQNNRKKDSDDDDDSSKNKNNEKKTLVNISDEHETDKSCEKAMSKKRKTSKTDSMQQNDDDVVSLDSDDENLNSVSQKKIIDDSESDSMKREENKKDSDSDSMKKAEIKSDSASDTKNDTQNMNDSENDSKKPIIKCVSLSKLLKPDVIIKNPIESHVPKIIKKLNGKRIQFDVIKKNEMLQKAKKKKDEFWAQKRKEVGAFKPKNYVVNITRLPKLSTDFLLKNNLNKITKNGDTICKITQDKSDAIVEEQAENSINKTKQTFNASTLSDDDAQLKAEANKVKNSLLNESDDDAQLKAEANKVKNSLLNESDDDAQLKDEANKVKNSLLNESDDDAQLKAEANKVKNSLLNESDDDAQLKDEANKVKNSLLNESDDDAQLKDEANKVKNSLLNESDDDAQLKAEANKVKNSLLNESDDDAQLKDEANKVKNTLLNESDDDAQLKDEANKVKNSLLNESDDDDAQLKDEANKVKNSLLNESDSDDEFDTNSKPEKETKTTVDMMKNMLLNSDSDVNEDSASNITSKVKKQETTNTKESSDDNEERISDKNSQPDSDKSGDKKSPAKQKAVSDSEAAKNDLLDKSDSDNKSEKADKSCKKYGDKNKINSENENDTGVLRNQKTPEKELATNKKISGKDDDAKTCLLNDSSGDETEAPLAQRREATLQSKKNRIRESVHAKNALLRYSSGSETDDGKLRNTWNEIKKSLLENMSDDENKLKAKSLNEQRRSSQEFSSSAEDILKKVKKKKPHNSNSSSSKKKHIKRKRSVIKSDSEERKNNGSSDGDTKSTSSISKMVRSKGKPGNSSSHSSDAQDRDEKYIDGITNFRTLNKSRRRNSAATDISESSNSTATRSRMAAKPTGLIGEELLKAESSSDSPSCNEDDPDDGDLPSVSLSGLNGGLEEHLVKEDLLGESDSSVSNKEESKDDSDEEERLNAKRRKANAIASSDSETGTVVKKDKDKDVRLSDFDNSDDSDITKRSKRKKKGSDSDASVGSSDAGKKKRRRIKSVNDSDASGSDSENDGKNKHGRKNIRKVMGKNQLEEATKKAAREEKERVARISERQKMYNNLEFDESGKPDEVVLDKVVLDFDPETKEPLIAVDRGLVKKLKPHQANGIKFMWDACFESVKRIRKDKGSGCILAHCMGLGKTLQVVALTHTLLAHDTLTKVHRVLVVCPLSTVLNWVNEFKMWLKFAERESDIDVYELSRFKQNGERSFQLSQWYEHGGVCVLGYEMFRNLSADNNKKFKKKMLKNFQDALVDPGPDLVVCDEGHLLKNEKTSLSQSMNKVKTLRRIVLTGTPLQNNLKEYYCMVQFVKPNLLGKYNEYLNRFVNPITNGQYTDSTEHDCKIMKRRSHVLHKMLDGAVQRRDYGVLAPFLPPKHEYVLFITLTEVQTKLYQFYLDNYSRRSLSGKSSGFLFPDFQSLQRIWTHPLVLKYNSERYEVMQQKKRDKEEEDSEGSLIDFIDDDSTPAESSSEESSDDSSELSDDSRKKIKKKKSSKKSKGKDKDKDKESAAASKRRGTRANPIDLDLVEDDKVDESVLEVKNENPTEWWIKLVEEDVLDDLRNSHKLVLLFDILRQCETIGDKLLVFSQSLYSLDLIEHFLGKVDEATQDGRIDEKLGGHVGSWSPGIDYFRLDGSTSCENRSIWCKNFNREDNPRARLFLISTRAGGLGINLVAANRVVIFDVSWNPSHDVQSIFRVYRFGQKKPCYVYRFLAMGTMEEKIYERQVTKQAISKRVIDEQQIDRHYAENDLAELYKFEAEPPSPRPLPPLPKDRLFAEMLREHEAQIYKYHEHDSLLENKEEETLSEEERKAAWEDFENEKNRPPPAPFPAPWPMNNGMMPNLLAQQQQQLAYAALAAMLRKDMPTVNDNQIRDMLPMIYNANPALMQKMSEIYKYSQQMNMAPGMMAQGGMNPASGGAGAMAGMGSTSGLQYEPPWQRQQQQQQQMRLQQLMAQQQNMGASAKLYAGGLGSRDPIAMALQQQRAREIMMAGGAGRPRGRPPLQQRVPPAPSADVVNLDSD